MSVATLVETAVLSGIASSPATDSYGHRVLPHAFSASIAWRGLSGPSSVKLLEGHAGLPIGRITELRTVGGDLRISAELNMELSRVRDLHSVIKHSGGLNYSVGFKLEEFDVVEDAKANEPWLIIKKGDLHEVSVVTFGACPTAQMEMKSRSLSPSQARAQAEWDAFASKARFAQFGLKMKIDDLRVAIAKAREAERWRRVDWDHLRRQDPRTRYNF